MKVTPAGPGPVALSGVDPLSGPAEVAGVAAPLPSQAAEPVQPVAAPDGPAGVDAAEAAFLAAVEVDFRAELARTCDGDPFLAARLLTVEDA